jgi:hypothetical protein
MISSFGSEGADRRSTKVSARTGTPLLRSLNTATGHSPKCLIMTTTCPASLTHMSHRWNQGQACVVAIAERLDGCIRASVGFFFPGIRRYPWSRAGLRDSCP